jgi:hypothetical protein
MNVIEFKLCAEDRQRLDEIIAFTGMIAAGMKSRAAAEHPADAPTAHLEPPVAAPAAIQPEPATVEPAPEVKPISLGEFQKAIVTRCAESAAMKAKVQALVHKYAPSVSEIPEGKRSEVLAALSDL